MIDAHWITTQPDIAIKRMRDHHEHGRMLMADAVRATPEFHRRIVHRDNNQQLHLSGQAISQMIVGSDTGGIHIKVGPGPEYPGRALAGAFWIFGEMVALVLDYFDLPLQENFEAVYAAGKEAFASESEPSDGEQLRTSP